MARRFVADIGNQSGVDVARLFRGEGFRPNQQKTPRLKTRATKNIYL